MNVIIQLTNKLYLMFLNIIKNQNDLDLFLFYVVLMVVLMAMISIFFVISSTQKQFIAHQLQINTLKKQYWLTQLQMNKYRFTAMEFDKKQQALFEEVELIKYHSLGLQLILKSKLQP